MFSTSQEADSEDISLKYLDVPVLKCGWCSRLFSFVSGKECSGSGDLVDKYQESFTICKQCLRFAIPPLISSLDVKDVDSHIRKYDEMTSKEEQEKEKRPKLTKHEKSEE